MIRFALTCADGHSFDSWFQSSAAYDALESAGHLSCAVCGSNKVSKSLMAPAVPAKGKHNAPTEAEQETAPSLSTPGPHPAEQALAEMRKTVEENSDYVGMQFASEARAIHVGDAPDRPIYGEAKAEEAKALIEDGIPVAPLPFMPRKRTN